MAFRARDSVLVKFDSGQMYLGQICFEYLLWSRCLLHEENEEDESDEHAAEDEGNEEDEEDEENEEEESDKENEEDKENDEDDGE